MRQCCCQYLSKKDQVDKKSWSDLIEKTQMHHQKNRNLRTQSFRKTQYFPGSFLYISRQLIYMTKTVCKYRIFSTVPVFLGFCTTPTDLVKSSGYTGWLASMRHRAVSMRMRTPVRPIPALQWTRVGARVAALSRTSRTSSTNSTNSTESSGVPWSGQLRYCIWVTTRASSKTTN